jgi:hypothetical protein
VLERVAAPGVFVEGNSFATFAHVDFMLMVARSSGGTIKRSARRALALSSALYLSHPVNQAIDAREEFAFWRHQSGVDGIIGELPVYAREDLPQIVSLVRRIRSPLTA